MSNVQKLALTVVLISTILFTAGCPTAGAPVAQLLSRTISNKLVRHLLKETVEYGIQESLEAAHRSISNNIDNSTAVQQMSMMDDITISKEGLNDHFTQNIVSDSPQINIGEGSIELECYESEEDLECLGRHQPEIVNHFQAELNEYEQAIHSINQYNENLAQSAQQRLNALDEAYAQCHDNLNTNYTISLDDHVVVFEHLLVCLKNKGFDQELQALAKDSLYFQEKLAHIDNIF